jgi:histidine triad (HIT) family protein
MTSTGSPNRNPTFPDGSDRLTPAEIDAFRADKRASLGRIRRLLQQEAAGQECVFCRIAAGAEPCFRLYEDDHTLAFMDKHPPNDGHCLVIPKTHHETIFDMSPESFAAVARTVVRIAHAVRQALQPAALNLVQANGAAAGQSVGHVHIHVLPRRAGDNLAINWPRDNPADPARLAGLAELIRRQL